MSSQNNSPSVSSSCFITATKRLSFNIISEKELDARSSSQSSKPCHYPTLFWTAERVWSLPAVPFSVTTPFLGLCLLTVPYSVLLTSYASPLLWTQSFLHSGWLREDWGSAVLQRKKRIPMTAQRTVPKTEADTCSPCPGMCLLGAEYFQIRQGLPPRGPLRHPYNGCWRSGVAKGGGRTEIWACLLP